ncbi:MAG: hypothetical protein JNL64_01700 [Blastocatellia bacterium]|nr:hypothetical protein [Blastocatellia bacterium]
MRKLVTISMSERMYDHLRKQSDGSTVSEYIRSLVRREQQRRADEASRPLPRLLTANESIANEDPMYHIEQLRRLLEQRAD